MTVSLLGDGIYLLAGVLSDRFDRRKLLIASDLIRCIAIGAMGLLALSGFLSSATRRERHHPRGHRRG
jgi:MFS family permease